MRAGSRKAVVIGAGGAGLAALHAMHQAGFDTIAFEQHGEIGGVWATTRYPSLTIHSKSFNYRFHDFPAVQSQGPSATREEIRAYFTAFARAKGIAEKIIHHRRVDRIVHRPHLASGRCLVFTTDVRTGEVSQHVCDVVICASGLANAGRPKLPELERQTRSNVTVLHSSELSQEIVDDIVTNRRKVVVLGAGKSAHEILYLFRDTNRLVDFTWVYVKSLWSMSYEKLYGTQLIPWNVIFYLYYLKLAALRRRIGFGFWMKLLQAPVRWSGLLVNPLEPHTDVCRNRVAIMKKEQLAFLKTVRSLKAGVKGLGERAVVLDQGDTLEADYLICATGYDRSTNLPTVIRESADGSSTVYELRDQQGFYHQMIDLTVPEVSVLAANVLYPQQVLGYSLGAQWLARFHAGTLAVHPTPEEMTRAMQADSKSFAPWCSGDYLSGGLPYAHQRNDDVLPLLFEQMGLRRSLAKWLVIHGANEPKFSALCEVVAQELAGAARLT